MAGSRKLFFPDRLIVAVHNYCYIEVQMVLVKNTKVQVLPRWSSFSRLSPWQKTWRDATRSRSPEGWEQRCPIEDRPSPPRARSMWWRSRFASHRGIGGQAVPKFLALMETGGGIQVWLVHMPDSSLVLIFWLNYIVLTCSVSWAHKSRDSNGNILKLIL